MARSTTSNLWKHLRRHHTKEMEDIFGPYMSKRSKVVFEKLPQAKHELEKVFMNK